MSDTELLAAMAEDCAGRQKQVAAEAFPTRSVGDAESELSAILAGRRRITPALLREVTSDPERTATLTYLAARAGFRLERVRQDPELLLDQVAARQAQLAIDLGEIGRLLERFQAERGRRGPHRAASPTPTHRRSA